MDDYRTKRLEKDIADLREELHTKYLDKYQLMNDYISKLENEKHLQRRREWPVIIAAVVCSACAVVTLVLTVAGH